MTHTHTPTHVARLHDLASGIADLVAEYRNIRSNNGPVGAVDDTTDSDTNRLRVAKRTAAIRCENAAEALLDAHHALIAVYRTDPQDLPTALEGNQ